VNGDLVAEGSEGAYGMGRAFVWGGACCSSPVLGLGNSDAEHVPDGGEDCPFDRDDGSEFSAAGGDASVLGAQVGVALSDYRRGGSLAGWEGVQWPPWVLGLLGGVVARLPWAHGVGQVRHPRGGLRADRLQGHAARVHALEQADPGAEQHG
jgi:hypothetical protein